MIVAMIEGWTRILGRSQGFTGLPVRDDKIDEAVMGAGAPCMTSAWEPTPEEVAAIVAGGKVYLRVMGEAHPPVMLWAEHPKQPPSDEVRT